MTGLIKGQHGHIDLCGHSPSALVALLVAGDSTQIPYQENGDPQVQKGALSLAAPGANGGVCVPDRAKLQAAKISGCAGNGAAWHPDKRGTALWTVFERALVRTINNQSGVWTLPTTL